MNNDNVHRVGDGRYIVTNHEGFEQAILDFKSRMDENQPDIEVHGCPEKYPSSVVFMEVQCYQARCTPLPKSKQKQTCADTDVRDRVIPVAAAIQFDAGVTVSLPKPARHHEILHKTPGLVGLGGYTQGFLTNTGVFVDRVTAATLALEAKLIERLETPPKLFTEDLWGQ